VKGLKGTLYKIYRGRIVDIPFVFPIPFDSLEIKSKYSKLDVFLMQQMKNIVKEKIIEVAI